MRKAVRRTGKGLSWYNEERLTDLDFADDITLHAQNEGKLQESTTNLNSEALMTSLRISAEKSKVMSIGSNNAQTVISVEAKQLETVNKFTYLGSVIVYDGDAETDARIRIAKAATVFQRLQPVRATPSISHNIKMCLYQSIEILTALYGSETWKIAVGLVRKINAFHQRGLRRIMKIRYTEHITNQEVLRRTSMSSLHVIVVRRRLRLAGHILRMPQYRIPRRAMY
ncbi:hypothetical protein TELCIR_13612 [Teladorsagia circumcincta]|uniref:Reverse transcriptase domain-containing protein n=1 Tax=Teladorsagia circumcincta TaxID=45464 RepID=A0A2G9U394_TELCI|nr:hypothetical protein TELCIR_13612 [Teladorsagia circumcincta]